MIAEKKQGVVTFKPDERKNGLSIDLSTGIVLSSTTGTMYKKQNINHLKKFYPNIGARLPQDFSPINASILSVSEAQAIINLYWHMDNHKETFAHAVIVMQMFYNRQYDVSFDTVIYTNRIIVACRMNNAEFVNYMIENEINGQFDNSVVTAFTLLKCYNININNLTVTQKRSIEDLKNHGLEIQHLIYIIRKMTSENVHLLLNNRQIIRYFELCLQFNQDYEQKNFFKAYTNLLFLQEQKEKERKIANIKRMQDDKFKFDTDKYYCVMPTEPEQFTKMGDIMRNCICSYFRCVANGNCTIVFVYDRKTNKPVLNLEIGYRNNDQPYLKQFKGFANGSLRENPRYRPYHEAYCQYLETITL